ncbi:MAG: hypothetical protein ACM3QW_02230 [Ignavibacteriales bacterium]
MSSFFKNLGETVAKTAEQVGSKSAELVNAGKNKVDQMQLESKVKGLKTDLGGIMFEAYKAGEIPNSEKITAICEEIKQLEAQIAALED